MPILPKPWEVQIARLHETKGERRERVSSHKGPKGYVRYGHRKPSWEERDMRRVERERPRRWGQMSAGERLDYSSKWERKREWEGKY